VSVQRRLALATRGFRGSDGEIRYREVDNSVRKNPVVEETAVKTDSNLVSLTRDGTPVTPITTPSSATNVRISPSTTTITWEVE